MKFALFTTTFYPTLGGAEKQLDLLARGLMAEGHQVVVIAPSAKKASDDLRFPYPVYRYPKIRSKKFGLRWHARFMERLHRSQRFDILHAHGAFPAAYMVMDFAKKHRLPLVLRAYGGDVLPGEGIAGSPWLRRKLERAAAAADRLIAQNAELVTLLGELSGHPERVVQIPNGLDLSEVGAVSPAAAAQWSASSPFVCTLSNLYPKKGLDLLLEAWAIVVRELPQARLIIAGHGPERETLRDRAEQLGIAASVLFPGNITGSEKWALLGCCEVYVSSARREPFSNALLEALAAGCRVVATDTGANGEMVRTCGLGELVPVGDIPALARALTQALKDGNPKLDSAQRRQRMAPYAYAHTLARYLAMVEDWQQPPRPDGSFT